MTMIWTYVAYLAISIALTIWVAWTLHRNGRIFLVDSFLGNEKLADSVNHLLVVGFYLINIGAVALFLKYGGLVHDAQQAIEYLSTKIGLVLVILGVMHFLNLIVFSKMRKRAIRSQPPADVLPAGTNEAGSYLHRLGTTKRAAFEQ
jgi:hypothetical protein